MLTFPSFRSHFYNILFIIFCRHPLHTFYFPPFSRPQSLCRLGTWPIKDPHLQHNTSPPEDFISDSQLSSFELRISCAQYTSTEPYSSQLKSTKPKNDLIWSHLILSHQLKSSYVILRHLLNSKSPLNFKELFTQKYKFCDHLLTLLVVPNLHDFLLLNTREDTVLKTLSRVQCGLDPNILQNIFFFGVFKRNNMG